MNSSLVSGIVKACLEVPRSSLEVACDLLDLETGDAVTSMSKLAGVLPKRQLLELEKALSGIPATSRELAIAFRSAMAGIDAGKQRPEIEMVWTGPDTLNASPRETLPQMLEMIGRARQSILLVTFAAYKVGILTDALSEALHKGVEIMIVVETYSGSAGQLTHDASKAFPPDFIRRGCIWHWPQNKRPVNKSSKPGKLHAKCLIVDHVELLISSANLTDDAMVRNIELGIRVASEDVSRRVENAFMGLVEKGVLERLGE